MFERFKAALVSTPYEEAEDVDAEDVGLVVPYLATNGLAEFLVDRADDSVPAEDEVPTQTSEARSVMDVANQRLSSAGADRVRQIWLDPLPDVLTLDRIFEGVGERQDPNDIRLPIGLLDDPRRQRQEIFGWDPAGNEGNLTIVGGPASGKSTTIRTILAAAALRLPPGDVTFYCVDYGGGSLGPMSALPNVAAVAPRTDSDLVRRTIAEVHATLLARETFFRDNDIDGMPTLRRRRAEGHLPAETLGDVVLVVDGWAQFKEDDEALEELVGELAARGPAYGIHVVVSILTTNEVRMRMQPSFGGRLELRLSDPFDSDVDRKAMEAIPKESSGRFLVPGPLYGQLALPRVDGRADTESLRDGVADLIARVAEQWPDAAVREVETLPAKLSIRDLPEPGSIEGGGVPVGITDADLGPAVIDIFGNDPHLVVFGDGQTGKSGALRTLITGLTADRGGDDLAIVAIDYRRSNLDLIGEEHLLAYCTTNSQTETVMGDLLAELTKRLPGEDVTPDQLRNRSWWTGPEVVVVIDDYDLVATSSGNPVAPLAGLIPQAMDIGFHIVLARRTGGVSRAMFEPVMQGLTDIGTPGLIFSGDRMEGDLVAGVRATELPVGRALFARRGAAPEQVQVAWTPEPGPDGADIEPETESESSASEEASHTAQPEPSAPTEDHPSTRSESNGGRHAETGTRTSPAPADRNGDQPVEDSPVAGDPAADRGPLVAAPDWSGS